MTPLTRRRLAIFRSSKRGVYSLVLFGFLFFAETPQATTLVGAAFIIAAGLYIFLREQALARRSMPAIDPA